MNTYFIIGTAWVVACLLIGLYIASSRVSGKTQMKIGLGAIFITFLAGLFLLFYAIAAS